MLVLAGLLAAGAPPAATAGRTAGAAAAAKTAARKARKKVRTLLRKRGIAKLPSVSTALAAGGTGGSGQVVGAAVIGTPPALVQIPGQSIKDLFWQPGVVDAIASGSATPEQCSQFFTGTHDGDSGGMGACHVAESVGYSFGDVVEGDRSFCYMKRFPTHENVAAGGASIVSGDPPGGDITRLFSVPPGADPRVVKVTVSGEPDSGGASKDVFLRIHSAAQNRAEGNFYGADIWFCKNAAASPKGFEKIRIDDAGHLSDESANDDEGGGTFVSTIEGDLTFGDGGIAFDPTKSRRAQVESQRGPTDAFKGEIEVRTDDTIVTKSYEVHGDGAGQAFVVTSFSGTGPDSIRFLAGAFKERHSSGGGVFGDEFTGATEFRSSFYASAPGSALTSQASGVDFDADAFYASPAAPSVDTTAFSCTTAADVAVRLDFANPTMSAAVQPCSDRSFDNMHFCHDDQAVQAAQQALPQTCSIH
jgi:hypothetical protein